MGWLRRKLFYSRHADHRATECDTIYHLIYTFNYISFRKRMCVSNIIAMYFSLSTLCIKSLSSTKFIFLTISFNQACKDTGVKYINLSPIPSLPFYPIVKKYIHLLLISPSSLPLTSPHSITNLSLSYTWYILYREAR